MHVRRITPLFLPLLLTTLACHRRTQDLHVATTTSVEASGLLDRLVPLFQKRTAIRLHVVAVGTGQALRLLERGDVGAVITHDPDAEMSIVTRGLAKRVEIMQNNLILVGPPSDPAGARDRPIEDAFRSIAAGFHPFVSRGDDSGTHRAEKRLWKAAGAKPSAPAYREAGQGMGETLTMASEIGAYTLVDTATFATFRQKIRLVPLVDGDPRLRNPYSVLWTTDKGRELADWLRSDDARALMRPLFAPAP
ncbi:MAG: substrate-binding domain-containing protein [Deltaproteobacteria bacterium]|nr:substrate-binding domain-containing protein [Deltaproteobacteria bacterium]